MSQHLWSYLDYADIIYDQPNNDSFKNKLERIQYNAALAITGAIRGTSRDQTYKEIGLESLHSRRNLHRLCTFHNIKATDLPSYLFKLISDASHHCFTRSVEKTSAYQCKTESFKSSLFPSTMVEWNKLDSKTQNLSSSAFKEHLIKGIRPPSNAVFNIYNPIGLKYITRLRLRFSHLNEHRFNHNFENCISPKCICSSANESTLYFFLDCHYYVPIRKILFEEVKTTDANLLEIHDCKLTDILLYGCSHFDEIQNRLLLISSIEYIMNSKRFDSSLF